MYRLRHRNRNKQRKILVISICSILLFMTAGYAAMNTNLEINAKGNVVKKNTGGEQLLEMVDIVTTGDGLYKDSYEENVYTYRGANPNNYVTFNNELWRIISVNTSDNTIKIMRNIPLNDRAFDTSDNERYNSSQYCNSSNYGCNIYGSIGTLYDNNLSPITELAREVNGTKYQLPNKESEMSTYLNGEYYNGLTVEAKSMIKKDAIYKVGVLKNQSGQTTSTDITQVSATKWKGKVATIDATEYVRASNNSSCTGAYAYAASNCFNSNSNHNWMYLNNYWWTLSPDSNKYSDAVWNIDKTGHFNFYMIDVTFSYYVRPVVTLSPEVKITSGDGTQNNSYQLSIES